MGTARPSSRPSFLSSARLSFLSSARPSFLSSGRLSFLSCGRLSFSSGGTFLIAVGLAALSPGTSRAGDLDVCPTCTYTLIRTALDAKRRALQAELPGYRAYAERTRYRLLPGVW